LTSEKKNLSVDSFVKWRINNAQQFYTNVRGDIFIANQRLDQFLKDGLRNEFGKRTLTEVVSGDRNQIMQILSAIVNEKARQIGVEVVDVRIRRIDLPEEVSDSVFARMRAERERVARDFRSRGQEAAQRIQADADRQRTVLLAEAYRDAEMARGEGDARSAEVYASAYNKDAEFYQFYRSLSAYRNSFNNSDDILVLQPKDSAFFRYFNNKPE
jgi:membrane protease subunit HflC